MITYPAVFFEDGKYIGVEFPDLPGCFSQADNMNNAVTAAKKALRCYLADIAVENYPAPSDYPDATPIEMYSGDDDSHTKLYNEQTQKVVVIPMDVEFLGEKLQKKILQAAGVAWNIFRLVVSFTYLIRNIKCRPLCYTKKNPDCESGFFARFRCNANHWSGRRLVAVEPLANEVADDVDYDHYKNVIH